MDVDPNTKPKRPQIYWIGRAILLLAATIGAIFLIGQDKTGQSVRLGGALIIFAWVMFVSKWKRG
jgi:hypothetical protein